MRHVARTHAPLPTTPPPADVDGERWIPVVREILGEIHGDTRVARALQEQPAMRPQ